MLTVSEAVDSDGAGFPLDVEIVGVEPVRKIFFF